MTIKLIFFKTTPCIQHPHHSTYKQLTHTTGYTTLFSHGLLTKTHHSEDVSYIESDTHANADIFYSRRRAILILFVPCGQFLCRALLKLGQFCHPAAEVGLGAELGGQEDARDFLRHG